VVARQGLQFAITLVLARLLAPAEFGTVALLTLFTAVASAFVDGGLSTALIQKEAVSRDDEATAFWINAAMGTLMAGALMAISPLIARFYDVPALEPLGIAMSSAVFLAGVGAVPQALLARRLAFKTILLTGGLATIGSGAVAIVLAANGAGVWSLAIQVILMPAITTVAVWVATGWRPSWRFSRESARSLLSFGGYVFGATLTDVVYNRAYTVVLGRFYGASEVGIYARAESTQQMGAGALTSTFSRVALPVFATAAGDPARLRSGARTAARSMMLVHVPVLLGLAAVGQPLIDLLFGSQWTSAGPIFQILCIYAVVWPLHVVNLQLLMAQGHSRLVLKLEVVKRTLGIALMMIGSVFGILGIAWSQVAFGFLAVFVNAHYTKVLLNYGAREQLRDLLPIASVSLPVAVVAFIVCRTWDGPPLVVVSSVLLVGAVAVVGLARAARIEALAETLQLLRSIRMSGGLE
jgi:teichuronic acid exporter